MNYFNYFTEIEDTFVRRRGRHLLLSPADWALIENWKTRGIPLYVALRGIDRSFDSYDAKPRRRSVKSLFYCQEEVEAQYAEWLDSRVGGGGEGTGETKVSENGARPVDDDGALPFPRETIAEHFARAREALEAVRSARRAAATSSPSSPPAGEDELSVAAGRVTRRLGELQDDFVRSSRPQMQIIEDELTQLEGVLDRALRSCVPAETLSEIVSAAEAQMRPYKDGMSREVYEQMLDNLTAKNLRENARLPRLSLFYI